MTDTSGAFLDVTFRDGRPIIAYYSLPRSPGARSVRTRCVDPGLVIDFDASGVPIGIEITEPARTSLAAFNRVLKSLGLPAMTRAEFAPLRAA